MDSIAPSRFPTTAADEQSVGTSRQITPERLVEAVAALRLAQRRYSRDKAPLEWAMLQNNLGNALARLGERERGNERIEDAIAAYRGALEVYTRSRSPLEWAMTQNNLGAALRSLGVRQVSSALLEEATAARVIRDCTGDVTIKYDRFEKIGVEVQVDPQPIASS